MAETDKDKKVTVRKLATDINISHDTLIEFLQKKGFDSVKSIMSKVEPDALEVVMKHFGKEMDVAEKRQKKVAAFKERRAKVRDEATGEEMSDESPEVVAAPISTLEQNEDPAPSQPSIEVPTLPAVAQTSASVIPEEVREDVPAEKSDKARAKKSKTQKPEGAPVKAPVEALSETEVPTIETVSEPVAEVTPLEVTAPGVPVAEAESAAEKADDRSETETSADGKTRRRRRKTTVIATSDPTDLRVTLPGLKIKGKIDLGPSKKDDMPALRKKGERYVNKVDGLVSKHGKKPGTEEEEKAPARRGRRGKADRAVDAKDVASAVKRTLAGMDESTTISGRARARKMRRQERADIEEKRQAEETERESGFITATEFLTASELANLMNVGVGDVISKCIALGLMVSINQRLDQETIQLVADEFGFQVEFQKEFTTDLLEDHEDAPESLKPRPPVVTIMGHVDHGKTSLLDYVRKANVVAGESGGITQHIGAYEVTLTDGRQMAFLDTPGHEAFTAMRSRGAQVTDIVILVVAADDQVMPQTLEAISHAQAASVPIVIALNKSDRPEANPERIRQQLADRNVLVEQWGGKYGCIEISAKTGMNIDLLLDRVLLEAELLDLKANPDREARGVIIEAEVDKGRGIQATILVQKGTLRLGDPFLAGIYSGRVRAMFDERGNRVLEAPPSTPVQLLGFDGIPQAGDQFIVVPSDSEAKEIANRRQQLKREQDFKQVRFITLDDISAQIKQGGVQHLRLILKGDVDGSVEALADSLLRLSTPEVKVEIVHRGVGAISENDVSLASASGAVILGFHVRPNLVARRLASTEHVEIRLYSVIYNCINDVRDALEGLLSPEEKEEVVATVEVRETFKVPKAGTVAGCYVVDGKITRNTKVRLLRDGIEIYNGSLSSLKRFKDDVREVEQGYECGMALENYNDIKVGDIIEGYKIVEIKRTLEKLAAARSEKAKSAEA